MTETEFADAQKTLDGLYEYFPRDAIKQRQGGGGKRLDYVETHTVINRLNRVVGQWDWSIKKVDFREDLCVVVGTLTIPGLGSRDGIGVQRVSERGGEDLVKGAAGAGIGGDE